MSCCLYECGSCGRHTTSSKCRYCGSDDTTLLDWDEEQLDDDKTVVIISAEEE